MQSLSDGDRKALKRFRLAQRLRDNWKFLAALKFYHDNLIPGKWTEVRPARRTGRRKLNPVWKHYLTASRRILGIVARCVRDSDGNILRDRKGHKRIKYYLRRDVWGIIQTRLCFDYPSEPGANKNRQSLFSNEFVEKKIKRDRLEWEFAFADKLLDPAIEAKFRELPAGFKMTRPLTELAEVLDQLLERTRAYLMKGIDPETGRQYAREERRRWVQWEEQRPIKTPSAEQQFREQLRRWLIRQTL